MAIIEAKNLAKAYYDGDVTTHALRGMSFTVDKGEFVAIMGPSGSGKSTLLHILGFLDEPTGGTYLFEGKNAEGYSTEDVAHIRNKKLGFIFQSFNLLPRTTVLDNVKLPLLYSDIKKGEHEKLSLAAIEAVGLSHRINHESSQLSGGEKQRVAIARALVNQPNIIFADEPTGNLDSKSGQKVMEIIQNLNEKDGHTIILITHEIYTAEHAQRVIKLIDGEIESDKKIPHSHRANHYFRK